ncbi:MAG: class I SAM-dependent methyltransferase [Acidobacteria bacterium]|nr:class I SAM-dependent methyltransferase [Acidobacteriota bacterium]
MEPTERFSGKVDAYEKHRPGYPPGLYATLRDGGLRPEHAIADIGSGTGISSKVFLDEGHDVWAVEPNAAMRAAAERTLGRDPKFHSIDGKAEATGLPDASVDWVVAGQAFHWFDLGPTRLELQRILRPGGVVAVFWNVRTTDTAFLAGYEALLLEYQTDYSSIRHENAEQRVAGFLGVPSVAWHILPWERKLPLDGLHGLLASVSYVVPPGDPRHGVMLSDLDALFAEHQVDGTVTIHYETRLAFSPLV